MSSAADSKRGMNVVTTAMAFSVSAFFVLFVFTRLLCARLHLSRAAAADRAAGDAFVVNVERGIHGLEPSVVTTFPTVKLADGGGPEQLPPVPEESQSQLRCTVCLEEYEAKDVVRVLPACGHAFHAPCIDAWLRQHPTCPVCRASLRAKPSSGGNRAAAPVDYSVVLAASATAAAAAGEAPAASTTQLVPAPSSSDINAASSPQADGGHRTDTGADGHQLEIVTEEPASLPGDRSPAAAAAAAVGGGSHSPCDETAGQRGSGAGASEHC